MRSPAFQFYPADYLSDENVELMTLAEQGCYIRLLCYCWREGSIPSDIEALARLCRCSIPEMENYWIALKKCFKKEKKNSTRLIHFRLKCEEKKQKENSKKRADAAKTRWQKEKPGHANALQMQSKCNALYTSTSITSSINPPTPKGGASLRFEDFWQTYPKHRRKEKAKCLEHWQKNKLDGNADSIIDGLARYCKTDEWLKDGGQFVPYPIRFLRNQRWTDEALDPSGSTKPVKPRWRGLLEQSTVSRNGEIIETRLLKPQSNGFIEHLETGEVFHVSELKEAQQ